MALWDAQFWITAGVGAVVGAVAAVGAERALGRPLDRLLKPAEERRRRRRLLREQQAFAVDGEILSIAGHRVFVAQFAPAGFRRADLDCLIRPAQDLADLVARSQHRDLFADVEVLKAAVSIERERLDAHPKQWNGESAGLDELHISRTTPDEDPILTMRFRRTDHANFLVLGRLWRDTVPYLPDGGFSGRDALLRVDPLLSQSFGMNATVETADGFIVVTRRASTTSAWHGKWHISVNEGVQGNDASANSLDLVSVLIRGAREELGIDLRALGRAEDLITFHTLILDVDRYEWGLLAHIDLRDTMWTRREINIARSQGAARDADEFTDLKYLPFDDSSEVVLQCGQAQEWIPHGLLNLVGTAVVRRPHEATRLRQALAAAGTPAAG